MRTIKLDPYNPHLYAIVKVGKLQHLQEIRAGMLRFRSLEFYRAREAEGRPWHDSQEGISSFIQSKDFIFKIEIAGTQHILTQEGGFVGATIQTTDPCLRVMCFHAIAPPDGRETFSDEDFAEVVREMHIPSSMSAYSEADNGAVLVILNVAKFMDRLRGAVNQHGHALRARRVKYVDFDQLSGDLREEDVGFVKSQKFVAEREWRIQLRVPEHSADVFHLDVASLEDISIITTIQEFNNGLYIRPKLESPND